MSEYKRRVSSTATVEASYEARFTGCGLVVFGPGGSGASPRLPPIHGSASDKDRRSAILGLAAGGQMYGARDLRLFIVSLISRTERRKYTVTQTRLGYSSVFPYKIQGVF